jgi:hypothetical protein
LTQNAVPKVSAVTTSGVTLMNSSITESGGAVGIGISAPWESLTVNGTINATQQGNSGSLAYKISGNSSWANHNLIGHWYTGTQDAISLQVPGNAPNNAQAVMLANGYFGLGTTSPSDVLTVRKTASGGITISSALDAAVAFIDDGTSYNFSLQNDHASFANTFSIAGAQSPWTRYLSINGVTGNVGIGTTSPGAKLEVNGSILLTKGQGGSITFQDGSTQTVAWTGSLCGGDYAESVNVSGDRAKYEPGDVLVIDQDNPGKFLKSVEAYATAVMGIYSTKPGVLGRRQTSPKDPEEVPMAMIGIVPAKVSAENGAIKPGDLLVTSSTMGYAMKGTDRTRMLGAVIGKALGSLQSGTGVIEVGVTLQ